LQAQTWQRADEGARPACKFFVSGHGPGIRFLAMVSIRNDKPSQYRARAQAAREKAAAERVEAIRKALVTDAELWERMADYEEKNPSARRNG
jgi:hypothetical protein